MPEGSRTPKNVSPTKSKRVQSMVVPQASAKHRLSVNDIEEAFSARVSMHSRSSRLSVRNSGYISTGSRNGSSNNPSRSKRNSKSSQGRSRKRRKSCRRDRRKKDLKSSTKGDKKKSLKTSTKSTGEKRDKSRSPKSKSPKSLKNDVDKTDLEKQDSSQEPDFQKAGCNLKLWGGISFLAILTVVAFVFLYIMNYRGDDLPQITDAQLDAYGIDEEEMYNPDVWITALKEFPQKQYTLERIPAVEIAIDLLKRQPQDPAFEKKMSILYHILTHIYYFTYAGQGIDPKWIRREKKYGDLLMQAFHDWAELCPNVKNPWHYKKSILESDSTAEYNMADYKTLRRSDQIEEAEINYQDCTVQYKFLDSRDRKDWEW